MTYVQLIKSYLFYFKISKKKNFVIHKKLRQDFACDFMFIFVIWLIEFVYFEDYFILASYKCKNHFLNLNNGIQDYSIANGLINSKK